jgi:hypothetical protein
MTDNANSEWRSGDIEGKTWCVYRWKDSHVEYVTNTSEKIKRFRSRAAANEFATTLNSSN